MIRLFCLFILCSSCILGCSDSMEEQKVSNGLAPAAPFAYPSPVVTEEIFIPVQTIVRRNDSVERLFDLWDKPKLYIAAFKLEEGPRGTVQIDLYVARQKSNIVYSNYPIRVSAHPSINIYVKPLSYPYLGDVVHLTDKNGHMRLKARSRTGKQEPIYFDVGGIKYKVYLGDS